MKAMFLIRRSAVYTIAGLSFCVSACAQNLAAPADGPRPAIEKTLPVTAGSLMQVEFNSRVKWKNLAPHSSLSGHLSFPVYAADAIAIPQGTEVDLTVESVRKLSRRSGAWAKIGHAIVRAFNPVEKSTSAEYQVELSAATLDSPSGKVPIALKTLRAGTAVLVEQKGRGRSAFDRASAGHNKPNAAHSVMLMALSGDLAWPAPTENSTRPLAVADTTDPAVRTFLLTPLSASRSRANDQFQARTAEPVRLGGSFFPSGSLIEGHVARVSHPKMLSRAGSMYLRIDRISSPEGATLPVSGTLGELEADSQIRPSLDDEGILRGRKPGMLNAVVDIGIAYALGKVTDDIAETPIRAVGAAMSDAAVANAARYFGLGAGAVFLVTRHGRDVVLPQYAELGIILGRQGQDSSQVPKP